MKIHRQDSLLVLTEIISESVVKIHRQDSLLVLTEIISESCSGDTQTRLSTSTH